MKRATLTNVKQPNIVIISSHDAGQHFGCYGDHQVTTPHIDELAADGVKFTNLFVSCPVCSPSRASMLTGCHPQTHGLMSLVGGSWNWTLKNPERHLSHILRRTGYHTRIYGYQDEAVDLATLGFDTQSSYLGPRMPKVEIDAPTMARDFADYVAQRDPASDQPFYAQIGFFEAHIPYDYGGATPDATRGCEVPAYCLTSNAALKAEVAAFQGMVRKADEGVGIIREALQRAGIERDTLVIFAVDHGADFVRSKRTMYDAGLKAAFIMHWPTGGVTGGKTCPDILSNIDVLPTLAEMLKLNPPLPMDGVSFASVLTGDTTSLGEQNQEKVIYAVWSETEEYAVRTHRYKLMRKFKSDPIRNGNPADVYKTVPAQRLFDVQADPFEQNDLARDPAYAATLATLNGYFYDWLDATDDPIRHGPTPTPYYRDAILDYHRARKQP